MSMPTKPTGEVTPGHKAQPSDPQHKDPKAPRKGMGGPAKDTPKQGQSPQGTDPGRK